MLNKNASLPSAPHCSTSGDCAENCAQCRWHRIRREQLYQVVGAGTSTIESVPCPLRWLNWHKPTRTVAPSCALPWRRHRHHRCYGDGNLRRVDGVNAIDPALKAELDAVNQLISTAMPQRWRNIVNNGRRYDGARLHTLLPELTTRQPVMVAARRSLM